MAAHTHGPVMKRWLQGAQPLSWTVTLRIIDNHTDTLSRTAQAKGKKTGPYHLLCRDPLFH